MAKLGQEVEGVNAGTGMATMFVSAEEFLRGDFWPHSSDLHQLYISDHMGLLDLHTANGLINVAVNQYALVTVEVVEMLRPPIEHPNLEFMLYIKSPSIMHLPPARTQIKLEHELNVIAAPMQDFIKTDPEQFEGDIILQRI